MKRVFRSVDDFTLEAFRASRNLMDRPGGRELAEEIRRSSSRCGGCLVAASAAAAGSTEAHRQLERARRGLLEARYFLYVARRLGLLDLRVYRQLASRQDVALRELEPLLRVGREEETVRPP